MIPHFTLRQNKGEYLIIRDADAFHIIDCNEALTKEKRYAILESGCTPERMQEMGLSGTTIPRSDIQAITVTGCGVQDDVIFYLGKRKKLCYWFPQAYDQKKVDDFFRGIPRIQYKTRRRLKGGKALDWRTREQDYSRYQRLRPVGWVYNILCALFLVFPLFLPVSFNTWSSFVLLMTTVAVGLDAVLPLYFTITVQRKVRVGHEPPRAINLGYGLKALLLGYTLYNGARFHILEARILPVAAAFAAGIGLLLLLLCREYREEFGKWLLALLLTFALCAVGLVPHLNYELGEPPSVQIGTVVHMTEGRTGKGHRTYHFTVRLPDGELVVLDVSREEYKAGKLGDDFEIKVGTGFFGIEYAIDG